MAGIAHMTYTHEYVDNSYVELSIPPKRNTSHNTHAPERHDHASDDADMWLLDPHHLHIWPRHDFMLIALPNKDGSFTSTLFAPSHIFKGPLSTRNGILNLFSTYFPDALELIGREHLVQDILSRKPSVLGSVKCDPYHYSDRSILIGDAAHAMLPFYGQGLNCGFEDVRVLMEHIDQSESLQVALQQYSNTRHDDLVAICTLAKNNYVEMSSKVISRGYLLRKSLDGVLMKLLPRSIWQSLYAMVTFSNLGYHVALGREERQAKIVNSGVYALGLGIVSTVTLAAYKTLNSLRPLRDG